MSRIAFVTDSSADLTNEEARKFGIAVVPQLVIFGGRSYRDGVDLTADEFYSQMANSSELPTTSQPSVGEFVAVFTELLKNNDTILGLFVSDKLSGTYRSAVSAAEMVGGDIQVINSQIASFGIGGLVMDGVRLARQGVSAEGILAFWESSRESMKNWFVVDTLEYLRKGGRIGGAAAVLGTLLQIKPILTIVDGAVDLFARVRTHHRAMEYILGEFDKLARTGEPLRLAVIHTQRATEAQQLAEELGAKYPHVWVTVVVLGAVITAHAGPGLLALLAYPLAQQLIPEFHREKSSSIPAGLE